MNKRGVQFYFVVLTGALFFTIIITSYLIYNDLSKTKEIELVKNRESILKIIGKNFSPLLKMGIHSEVDRYCKTLLSEKVIDKISVKLSDGELLCDKKLRGRKVYIETLFFSDRKTEILATVSIQFVERTTVFKPSFFSLSLLLITVVAIVIVFTLFKFYIQNPIQYLSLNLEGLSEAKIPKYLRNSESIELFLRIREMIEFENKRKTIILKEKLNKQIAHDIRSPLEALRSATNQIDNLDYSIKQLLNTSIGRISDIANGLLKNISSIAKESNIRIVLEELIEEKKFEFGIKIHYKAFADYNESFSFVDGNDLYRGISNIVNNAYESQLGDFKRIEIELVKLVDNISIQIKDFGSGIDEDLITKIMDGGYTTKDRGNGLGVSYCKKVVESVNGAFYIKSLIGEGTTVTLEVPVVEKPKWFTDKLEILNTNSRVIAIDDDPSFLSLYSKKLKGYNLRLVKLNENDIKEYSLLANDQFFFDYDLGQERTGLDFIIENNLASRSTLVTSMYQDVDIQERCIKNNIKILPKQIFNKSKVIITNPYGFKQLTTEEVKEIDSRRIVLIDDDQLMHMSWCMEAEKKSLKVDCFFTVSDFIDVSENYSRNTRIFIDSNLKDGIKGEIESIKIVNLGFSELFIATGYSPEDIDKPYWIKDIVGKTPKFD